MQDTLNEPLIRTQTDIFTGTDLLKALKELGINDGDDLCVHSAIHAFGLPAVKDLQKLSGPTFLGNFVDALKAAVGTAGTLLMPTFTYSFCKNEPYDLQSSPSTVGVLTEYFRKLPETRRTGDPIFSFAVWGKRTAEYLKISPFCFGVNSVFDKLYRNRGKIVFFGTSVGSMTFIHYVENLFKVPYRYDKTFTGEIIESGVLTSSSCVYYVRDINRKSIFNTAILRNFAISTDNLKQVPYGAGVITVVDAFRLCNDLLSALKRNPLFLLGED